MPTLLELLEQNRNGRNGYWVYLNENPGAGEKDSQTNKNEGEQKRKFKDQQSAFGPRRNVYGLLGTIFIESRGLINPGRAAALLVSSPVPAADLIGGQINGFLGGNSNRPDDTIFRNRNIFSKPITLLAVTRPLLRDAVQAKTQYYLKRNPFPGNILKNIISAFNNPAAFVSMGAQALNEFGGKSGFKKLQNLLKRKGDPGGYGPKKFAKRLPGEAKGDNNSYVRYSENYTLFSQNLEGNNYSNTKEYKRQGSDDGLGGTGLAQVKSRKNTKVEGGVSKYDYVNDKVLSQMLLVADTENIDVALNDYFQSEYVGYTFVSLTRYGTSDVLVLPSTITGLSEDVSPQVNPYKYVGSPFNLYRYTGVERSIKFDLKLYAANPKHEMALRMQLIKLRELVYPDKDISVVSYASNKSYSPLFFSPNLVELNIYGLYRNILTIIDSLSISVDDNVSWASDDYLLFDETKTRPHPTVFNVSLSFKVVERPNVEKGKDDKYIYQYGKSEDKARKYDDYFTGYSPNNKEAKIKELTQPEASDKPISIQPWLGYQFNK
jgi:hypothetical protein